MLVHSQYLIKKMSVRTSFIQQRFTRFSADSPRPGTRGLAIWIIQTPFSLYRGHNDTQIVVTKGPLG